jgi:hypothetical protein
MVGLETLQRSERVSLVVLGNPMPFAVGSSNVSYEAILVNRGQGKAVNVFHTFGDKLCKNSIAGPNHGFNLKVIRAIEDAREPEPPSQSLPEVNQVEKPCEERDPIEEAEASASELVDGVAFSANEASRSLDETIMRGLLLAVRYLIKDDQLPYLASNLWKQIQKSINCDPHYLPDTTFKQPSTMPDVDESEDEDQEDRPISVDIKKSCYRQVAGLLKYAKEISLLDYENDHGIINITSINRHHHRLKEVTLGDELENFRSKVKAYAAASASAKAQSDDTALAQLSSVSSFNIADLEALTIETFFSSSSSSSKLKPSIKVIDLYKPSRQLCEIFCEELSEIRGSIIDYQRQRSLLMDGKSTDKSIVEVYTHHEIKDMVTNYISHRNLEDVRDKRMIVLLGDDPLHSLLPKPKKHVEEEPRVPVAAEVRRSAYDSEEEDADARKEEDEYEDDFPVLGGSSVRGSSIVGGVMLSSISSQSSSSSPSSSSSTHIAATTQPKAVWKPIYLPSSTDIPTAAKPSSFASATSHPQGRSKDKVKAKEGSTIVANEPITIKKDIFFNHILQKMSTYYAIVASQGNFNFILIFLRPLA